ncbi:MAG: DMT family transporter [Anaerolineales bacterium]|nr:DMT family transporter [Anaerolineales bacterium]
MQTSHKPAALPFIILIAILAISTSSIFIRLAQAHHVPSLVIATLRVTFATLLLAPLALTKYLEQIKRLTRTEILLGGLAGFFLAIHFATWITSLEYTSVASSAVFVTTGPLWVALLSPVLLNEKLSRWALLGLGLSLVGGIIVGLADACAWDGGFNCTGAESIFKGKVMWGNFLALCGAWAVTGYLIIGRKIRAGLTLIPYIFLVYGMASVTLIIFTLVSGNTVFGYEPKAYFWIFLLALIPQLIGHSTYNWSLKYLSASLVSITTLGEPIGSAVLAFFILSEAPPLLTYCGGALILAGIYLSSRSAST